MIHPNIWDLSDRLIREKNQAFSRYYDTNVWEKGKSFILLGPRGIGKTTLLMQYLNEQLKTKNDREVLYIQADHIVLGDSGLYEIAEQFYNQGGKILAIDEIHKQINWSRELKSIIDTFPRMKLLCSGSSILDLLKGTHDLSRRLHVSYLRGFSFREFVNFKLGLKLPAVTLTEILSNHRKQSLEIITKIKSDRILSLFHEYLRRGYYPFSFETKELSLFQSSLENTARLTVEIDVPGAYPEMTEVSIQKILKLLKFLAQNVPYEPDLKKLKELLDIGDERTLKNYLQILEKSGILRLLYSSNKSLKVLIKPEKIYLDNPNLAFALNPTLGQHEIGSVREVFLMSMVGVAHSILYTKQGDFIVDNKVTFEVGGKNKTSKQIRSIANSYLALDDMEMGSGASIPIWLFGFLY